MRTLFKIKGFAHPDDVQPVVDALPSKSASISFLNTLQDLKVGPSRDCGARLIRSMNSFQDEARLIYQDSVARLDNAFKHVGGLQEKAMSLSEIAAVLLHPKYQTTKGEIPPPALYAVHTALRMDDVGFQPASRLAHEQSYIFRVSPESDVRTVQLAEMLVREYYDSPAYGKGKKVDKKLAETIFGRFILRARKVIDDSRRSRAWSPYGMLKPSSAPTPPPLPSWLESDREFISFIHMWAASQKFGQSSRHHWSASAILRALDRYQDAEYLEQHVAWTFLQEIGWVKPWEIQARYTLSLPGVQLDRGGGITAPRADPARPSIMPDVFEGRRKSWAGSRTFCIDAESATDIDDGISLERTEVSGEYWIHVHVADPASCVRVDSVLANQASLVPQTVYLPGHFSRMFDHDAVREQFSLAPGRPCLTFSAKVDDQGSVLDYTISPARLGDVSYLTAETVSEVCGEEQNFAPSSYQSFAIGKPPTSKTIPDRALTKARELSGEDTDDLRALSKLSDALQARRLKKGAMPLYLPSPSVQVSFDNIKASHSPDGFMRCSGDPYIRISYDQGSSSSLVNSIMQLAGEVAARWCHERGVPIPYRVQPRAAENMGLLRTYTRDVLYPQLLEGRRPNAHEWQIVRALSGGYDISTTPTPHFTMGLDLYTKATSPLRRYTDLLVHWQIEAALLEEERRHGGDVEKGKEKSNQKGKEELKKRDSLVGNTDDSFLSFTRRDLERDVFPMLRLRERHAVLLDRTAGANEWMLQALVRAWKFGEQPLPATAAADTTTTTTALPRSFRFAVGDVVQKRVVKGRLDWFERSALMEPDGLAGAKGADGLPLTPSDVNVGDVFEVELKDVIVSKRRIIVKALRRVDGLGTSR